MSVEIKLSRSNRIYRPNEPVEGKIVTKLSSSISHQGIRLKVNTSVNLQVRGGSAGVIESFYGVIKPITILNKTVEVLKSGRISSGSTEKNKNVTGTRRNHINSSPTSYAGP